MSADDRTWTWDTQFVPPEDAYPPDDTYLPPEEARIEDELETAVGNEVGWGRVRQEARRHDTRTTSWGQPVDVRDIGQRLQDRRLAGPVPTVGRIDGGGALFYRGEVNGVAGETGSAKTWTALATCAQVLAGSGCIVYIDLEASPVNIVGRLLDMGVKLDDIDHGFIYLAPTGPFRDAAVEELVDIVRRARAVFVVIDSTGEALVLEGAKPNADEDVARWFRVLPTMLARLDYDGEIGPAVAVLDHQSKSGGGSMWPIGSQRKLAAITGVQYIQEVVRPFRKGQPGYAVLKCAKDRHGTYGVGERIARLTVEPSSLGCVTVSLVAVEPAADDGRFRPTDYMERISHVLEAASGPLGVNDVATRVRGNKKYVSEALEVLIEEGYVSQATGPNRSKLHTLIKPFSEAEAARTTSSPASGGSGSGPLEGNREPPLALVPEPLENHREPLNHRDEQGGEQPSEVEGPPVILSESADEQGRDEWIDPGCCGHGVTVGGRCSVCGGTARKKEGSV